MRNYAWILLLLDPILVDSFVTDKSFRRCNDPVQSYLDDYDEPVVSRRDACFRAVVAGAGAFSSELLGSELAWADDDFQPAKRPTAYRVDSTQPPTLIPLQNARQQAKVLKALGKGSGTNKEAILDDRINLNNMMNKAIFGTIDAVSSVGSKDESSSGVGYASFMCMGVPRDTTSVDIDLAVSLLSEVVEVRSANTALGIAFCPMSAQPDLDKFLQSGDELALTSALFDKGVPKSTVQLYLPLLRFAKSQSVDLLALSPELSDIKKARTEGLQNVSPENRASYVLDTAGFIALSQDPKYRLYTDRSLLKDFKPLDGTDKPGDFFAERILVHETAATAVARYGAARPDSFVAMVAPIQDLRFLGGINKRIPRICQFLNNANNKVTENSVTTVLLNPTAEETLSKSRFLRLEIGTGPETLDLQTKVADYLWFSSPPKVNMIPRLMNA